jgi:predicted CXXCH cytochrome family protein
MNAHPYAEPGLTSFKREDRLAFLQRHALWLAPLAALLLSAVGWAVDRHRDRQYSPGPVAAAHATWEDRCEVCHASSRPISADNWLGRLTGSPHSGDAACVKCHRGPPHYQPQPGDVVQQVDTPACSACHREHRGEQTSLVRVADEQCVRCHRDPAAHVRRVRGDLPPPVTAFDGDLNHHPAFKPASPGKLKFNHKLHMTRGISRPGDGATFLLRNIPEAQRVAYGSPDKPEAPVQLECASCHQLDAGGSPTGTGGPPRVPAHAVHPERPAGAYMLPITYEAHCQACHPLSVGHEEHVFLRVPHRLPLSEMRAFLEGQYAPLYLKKVAALQEQEPPRPLPGRPPRPADPLQGLAEALRNPVDRAEQHLYETRKGCVLCHDLAPDTKAVNRTGEPAARQIVPTELPTVWLRKATFNHATHRLLECRSCHPRADAYADGARSGTNADASVQSSDLTLPGIDACFRCHSAGRQPAARSACVECHRYHGGDFPLEGKGAARRAPARPVSIEEFLHGP